MPALAQNNLEIGGIFGITPPPVNPRRRTTTAPPPPALNLPPVALPEPTPRPTPAVGPRNGNDGTKGRITVGPSLPCADCDPGNGQAPPADPNYATARIRSYNKTGGNGVTLGSRNFNWAANLISLPGRAGMDFNLSLAYNSLVWTRQGNYIRFNADMGTPAPGFQLGFPKLEGYYTNSDTAREAVLLMWPSGARTELIRKYDEVLGWYYHDSEDGSFLRMLYYGNGTADMYAPGGLVYHFINSRCTAIEDRNGNYLALEYDADGHLTRLEDALDRVFIFNYSAAHTNSEHNLISVTQSFGGNSYLWATFDYDTTQLTYNFTGLTVNAPASGSNITVLKRVTFADGSSVRFEYTPYGQIWRIQNYAANGTTLLAQTSYNLNPGTGVQTDCPRFTERREWAREWNGDVNGVPGLPNDPGAEDVITTYSVDPAANATQPAWSQVTTPDGVTYKENYHTSGPYFGLTSKSEVIVNNVVKKWVDYTWEQLSSAGYAVNPRLKEVKLSDDSNGDGTADKQRLTKIFYDATNNNPYNLPAQVEEYKADLVTLFRRTVTEYEWDAAYLNRRLFGLVKKREVYGEEAGATGLVLLAKTTYDYDWDVIDGADYLTGYPEGYLLSNHDTPSYGPALVVGRGNLTRTMRWDVNYPNDDQKAVDVRQGYDMAGSVRFTLDALGRKTVLDYQDRGANGYFSVGNGAVRTYAFVTSVTDPEQVLLPPAQQQKAYLGYNYEKGLLLKTEGLKPKDQTQGRIQTYAYDAFDRLEQVTTVNNGAYTRWEYPGDGVTHLSYSTVDSTTEVETKQITDGAGRVIRARTAYHNGNAARYRAQSFVYDNVGRVTRQMYPLEVDASWTPAGDDAGKSWNGPLQAYDWQGRPTTTTNVDGTQRVIEYVGCGCAGQDTTTVRDESGHRRKYYKDFAGRLVKVEELDWNPNVVYSTTTYEYNGRDQLERILQNGGRERKFEYDGHGRLEKRTTPEQGLTQFAYNRDDSVDWTKDARQVKTTFGYYPHGLVANITYDLTDTSGVAAIPNVSFAYDTAGNRTEMVEGGQGTVTYNYDQLSRLTSETRGIDGIGSYSFNYTYNLAGQLKTLQNPFGAVTNYNYNVAGQVTSVTGSGTLAPPTAGNKYIDNITYRAFGGVKQVGYGNGRTLSLNYTNRLFLEKWDLPNNNGTNTSQTALGYQYQYNQYGENYTGRPDFAQSLYDNTLDRAWTYDNVGCLIRAYTGIEAHAQWGAATGPYAQGFDYDQYGNITQRFGWGGENPNSSALYGENPNYSAAYNAKNQNPYFQYDAAGNLLSDGGQSFTYDAQGQQRSASFGLSEMRYDGDGVRLKKVENGVTTYCLRSTVLGQQVACKIQSSDNIECGGVYPVITRMLKKEIKSSLTKKEKLTQQLMHPVWLVARPPDFFVKIAASADNQLLSFGLTVIEWRAIYFDTLKLTPQKSVTVWARDERLIGTESMTGLAGEIKGFPLLSRIRSYLHDAVFVREEIPFLESELVKLESLVVRRESVRGLNKLKKICSLARKKDLCIVFLGS